jgi:hypothetical protein
MLYAVFCIPLRGPEIKSKIVKNDYTKFFSTVCAKDYFSSPLSLSLSLHVFRVHKCSSESSENNSKLSHEPNKINCKIEM